MKNNSSQIFVIGGWKESKKEGEKRKNRRREERGREGGRKRKPTPLQRPQALRSSGASCCGYPGFPPALPGNREAQRPTAGPTHHGRDVDDPLHRLGLVDTAPQQALRIQAALGVGIAEPGQQGGFARHAGQSGAIRGRGPGLGGGGAGGSASAAAAAVTSAVAAALAVAAAVAVTAAARGRAGRPAPGGPVGEPESGRQELRVPPPFCSYTPAASLPRNQKPPEAEARRAAPCERHCVSTKEKQYSILA